MWPTVVALVALVVSVHAQTWKKFAECDSEAVDDKRLLLTLDEIKEEAQEASQVRICTTSREGASSTDCVTSKVDGIAINNLRQGFVQLSHYEDIAHSDGNVQYCDQRCVSKEWTANSQRRLDQLDASGGGHQYDSATGHSKILYWAYGNKGLHFTLDGHRKPGGCGWQNKGGAITVYMNSGPITTSTATTTTHALNPVLDDAMDKIAVLGQDLAAVTKVMEVAKTTAFENQAAVETMGEKLAVANDLIANATAVNAKLSAALQASETKLAAVLSSAASNADGISANTDAIAGNTATAGDTAKALAGLAGLAAALQDVGALVATPQACNGDASCSAPTVAADGTDLVLGADAGNVLVKTKECGNVDVCKLAQVVNQIKDGLKDLL